MEKSYLVLTSLLSSAIRGEKPKDVFEALPDWHSVYLQAKAHDVTAIVYTVLKYLDFSLQPESRLASQWNRDTVISGVKQLQFINQASSILTLLNQKGIPTVVIKGFILKELYPQPELRTFSDLDIFVDAKHLQDAREILLSYGYMEDGSDFKHIRYCHGNSIPVELHSSLVNWDYIGIEMEYEEIFMQNTVKTTLSDTPVLTLAPQYHLLYLCLHLSEHMLSYGFGLRQLCDLVLLVESARDKIDWNWLNNTLKELKKERFIQAVFTACRQLLHMKIPEALDMGQMESHPLIQTLVCEILSGGTFGNQCATRNIESTMLRYSSQESFKGAKNKVINIIQLVFPPAGRLRKEYSYCLKYPFLLPVSWIHRLLSNIFRKDFFKIVKFLLFNPKANYRDIERRSHLLSWLGLKL